MCSDLSNTRWGVINHYLKKTVNVLSKLGVLLHHVPGQLAANIKLHCHDLLETSRSQDMKYCLVFYMLIHTCYRLECMSSQHMHARDKSLKLLKDYYKNKLFSVPEKITQYSKQVFGIIFKYIFNIRLK